MTPLTLSQVETLNFLMTEHDKTWVELYTDFEYGLVDGEVLAVMDESYIIKENGDLRGV